MGTVCNYIHRRVYIYNIHIHINTCLETHKGMYLCLYTCVSVHLHIHIYICTHLHSVVFLYTDVYFFKLSVELYGA